MGKYYNGEVLCNGAEYCPICDCYTHTPLKIINGIPVDPYFTANSPFKTFEDFQKQFSHDGTVAWSEIGSAQERGASK